MSDLFLFMGEQEDPEMDVWLGRQMVRIYDATREPTEAELRLNRETKRESTKREGGAVYLTGGGQCLCGRCLFESHCPKENGPVVAATEPRNPNPSDH
jgi:hypothetical protein